jgi:hypothetical protein
MYSAAQLATARGILNTAPESSSRALALATEDATVLRKAITSNSSTAEFQRRLEKLRSLRGAVYQDTGDGAAPRLVIPMEAAALLRALVVLSPKPEAYRGRSLALRALDSSALGEHAIFCASGGGGRTPFGALSPDGTIDVAYALEHVMQLWRAVSAGPARTILGHFPPSLVVPTHNAAQWGAFLRGERHTLLIPCGHNGRVMMRALFAAERRRYVLKNGSRVGDLVIFDFFCCRHEKPLVGRASVGAGGSRVASGSADDDDGTLGDAGVVLQAAYGGAADSGKKAVIARGCTAALKLAVRLGADFSLLLRGPDGHNHTPESDDAFLPWLPAMLKYVHERFTERRDPTALKRLIAKSRDLHVLNDATSTRLLKKGPTGKGLAAEAQAAASLLGAGGAGSAERFDRARGIGPPLLPSSVAAGAAAAELLDADDDGAICYCRESRSGTPAEAELFVCNGAAAGVPCANGSLFHPECVDEVDRSQARSSGSFVCLQCETTAESEPGAAFNDLDDDDEGASADAADAAPLPSAGAGAGAAAASSTSSSAPSAAASAPRTTLRELRGACGVPRHLSAFRRFIEECNIDSLYAQLRLLMREGRAVAVDTLQVLEEIKAAAPALGNFCELVYEKNSAGVVESLRFSWATLEMYENARAHGLTDTVVCRDYTHGTLTVGFHLGACVGVAAGAFGASCPIAYHLVLAEKGVEDSWTRHLVGAARFVTSAMSLPEPAVQFTDKDWAAIKAWLIVQREKLREAAAHAELERVLHDLDEIAASATPVGIELARCYVTQLPSFVTDGAPSAAASDDDGLSTLQLPPPTAYPPSLSELQQRPASLPPEAVPASPHLAVAASETFASTFLFEYAPLGPALASLAAAALRRIIPALKTASSGGEWNELAAQLLWLRSLAKPGSALNSYLTSYVFRFTLLCDFHTYQALERAFKKDGIVPMRILKPFTAHVRSLFAEEIDYSEFKRLTRPLLEESGAPLVRAGGEYAVYAYLEKHWLCVSYYSLVRKGFRELLSRLGIDTTNIVEGGWSVLKVWYMPLLAFKSVRALISVLSGLPLAGTVAAESRDLSLVARRIYIMSSVAGGRTKRSDGYKIDIMLRRFKLLADRAESSAAIGSNFISYDSSFDLPAAKELGAYVVGIKSLGGWTHESRGAPSSWSPPCAHMSAALLSAFPTVEVAQNRLTGTRDDYGRSNGAAIAAAVAAARLAANGTQAPPPQRAGALDSPAQRIAALLKSPLAGASEFHSLRGRSAAARTAVLLSSGGVRQLLVERLEPLFIAVVPDALGLVRANQAARRVLSDEAWPALVSADFGSGKAPRLGGLYIDMLTMPARDWLNEALRVLVRGETLSKMSHCPLRFNFKVVLAAMMPLAAAAVEAGLPDELLTSTYVGQELRAEGCFGQRMRDHMGTSGNANIREIAYRTSKRRSGHIITPLSSLVVSERRFLAFTAPDSETVNFAEDALICLVFLLPGVVPLNSSPGNCGGFRYLDETPAGPPLLFQALAALLDEHGKRRINLATRLPADGVPPFLRRALVTASLLLEAGRFNADDGERLLPMLTVGGGGAAAASEKLVFSQEQCVAALLAGDQSNPHRVQLLTNACTCSRRSYVCEHILACRVLHLQRGLPPLWADTEMQLYGFGLTREAASSAAAPAASEEAVLDAAAPAAPSRDARADMVASLLSLLALSPDLDAAEVERVAPQLQRMALKALQTQRSAVVGGAGSHSGSHVVGRRALSAADVANQESRVRLAFATPRDAVSGLLATLQLASAGPHLLRSLPDDASAADAIEWQRAVLRAGGTAAADSITRVSAQAAATATLAASVAAAGASSSVMSLDGDFAAVASAGAAAAPPGALAMTLDASAASALMASASSSNTTAPSALSGAGAPLSDAARARKRARPSDDDT